MTTDPTEAERELRQIVADADLQDERLDAFRARLPAMRTSDLIFYPSDNVALAIVLGLGEPTYRHDAERTKLIAYAAIFAIKDEIDRRLPIPKEGA